MDYRPIWPPNFGTEVFSQSIQNDRQLRSDRSHESAVSFVHVLLRRRRNPRCGLPRQSRLPRPPATSLSGAAASASGKDSKAADDTEIKPYTGPPIFLDEPEAPPAPSMVDRTVQSDKFPDGKLRIERQVAKYSDNHYVADGFYREYYPNGQKFVDGQYKAGRPDGQWTYWYDNGTQNRQITFKDGQPDGSWEVHRADGTLMAARSFKNGKRDGVWTIYDDTGKQPLRVESYADGKADGEWKIWFPSGQLQRQINFKQGDRDGAAIEWDEKGNKRIEMNYAAGKARRNRHLLDPRWPKSCPSNSRTVSPLRMQTQSELLGLGQFSSRTARACLSPVASPGNRMVR